jgi:LL-diaminopimelate aminotransferase
MKLVASQSEPLVFPAAARLSKLPAYIFVRLDELKANARRQGMDLIDLGLGNPDGATPAPIVRALEAALEDKLTHGYPPFAGRPDFKQAIAQWMNRRYEVVLDPDREILPLIGSKEGLAHLALAYVDVGDVALIPNPCYPVHLRGSILAGGSIYEIPLKHDHGFLPDLDSIPNEVAARAKILILNYPNNPTAATAPDALFEKAVWFCRKNHILLVHDLAYGELYYGDKPPRSLLEFSGAKEVGVEFHTLSKTFNMAGWRIGFVVGNSNVIKTLYALKTNVDYGIFGAIQLAGQAALDLPDSELDKIRMNYRRRRDLLTESFKQMGWPVDSPQATMYIWLRIPEQLGMTSTEFAETLLARSGVVVTPGVAFGSHGEGFVRVSMVADEARLQEAMQRWKAAGF